MSSLINIIIYLKSNITYKTKVLVKIIKVFLSYKWEDKESANDLEGLLNNPNNKFRHITDREHLDMRNKGEKAVKNYLKGIISDCDALVCLIGDNTHNSTGVKYELQVAQSLKKKIVGVRIPLTNGGLPHLLKSWNIPAVKWDAHKINDKLSLNY